jgi:mannose-1-phosphate guanylyltransferase
LKAFLLAAGHGTRLRPLTDTTPKCLLPIRGVPLLQIWLRTCALFGIDEVLINVHAHASAVRHFLHTHPSSISVRVVEENELLGSAGTIIQNRDWIGSTDSFWVFYADVLCRIDLAAMLQLHRSTCPVATIGAYRVADPTRCGILEVNERGNVTDFVEKPSHPKSNLAFSGILLGTQMLLDAVPSKNPVDFGFDVFPKLIGKMMVYPITSYLMDIGTMQNYQLAQSSWPGFDA